MRQGNILRSSPYKVSKGRTKQENICIRGKYGKGRIGKLIY
jgi:hypothetical protein